LGATTRASSRPSANQTTAAMPQLTAISVRCLSSLNSPSNGPASQLAASFTALTSWLDWFALSSTSAIPMTRMSATTAATIPMARASISRPRLTATRLELRRIVPVAAMTVAYPLSPSS
jgi:hypothetical protein